MRSNRTLKAKQRGAAGSRPASGRARLRGRTAARLRQDSTKDRLVQAALKTLTTEGFYGTTARAIARTGGLNQALIFYHFGSVDRLLLAALDATSQERLGRYREALAVVTSLTELVEAMAALYEEDVRVGHVAAVQELIAGGSSVPGLRKQVVDRMEPWVAFAEEVLRKLVAGTVFEALLPTHDLAYAAVALYFGVETVSHLQGDRSRAASLFEAGKRLAPAADAIRENLYLLGEA